MDKRSILARIKSGIASIAWHLFLWGNNMTNEEYWKQIYDQELARRKRVIESKFQTIDGVTPEPGQKLFYTRKTGLRHLYEPVSVSIDAAYLLSSKQYYVFASETNARNFIKGNNERIMASLK